jgi:hypothetical protein
MPSYTVLFKGRGRKFETEFKEKNNPIITEANIKGARLDKACAVLGLSIRTYERGKKSSDKADKRKGASKKIPKKLSDFEKKIYTLSR